VRRINILVRAVCGALSGNIARHVNVRAARSDPAARPLRFSAFKRCEILERPILVQRSTSRSSETKLNAVLADKVEPEVDCKLQGFL
jgi:hypothetical protein